MIDLPTDPDKAFVPLDAMAIVVSPRGIRKPLVIHAFDGRAYVPWEEGMIEITTHNKYLSTGSRAAWNTSLDEVWVSHAVGDAVGPRWALRPDRPMCLRPVAGAEKAARDAIDKSKVRAGPTIG